jgi:type II secretory pathway component GspD/PulD (secretin)
MNRSLNLFAAGALVIATFSASAIAQSTETKPAETSSTQAKAPEAPLTPSAARAAELYDANRVIKTYYLTSVTQQNDANEILIALRNILSVRSKLYLVQSQNAIVLSATPEDQTTAQRIIKDLDRPHRAYRLTFTLADSENGKRIGVQHFSIIVAAGQRTTLKQGSKIPVITGTYQSGGTQTQFQYLDIGMNFDVSLSDSPGGLLLKAKVEDSSVGTSSEYGNGSGPLAQEPIVHQTALEGTSIVTLGKPLTLGSVDVAGSTRHVDIEVVAEPVS